MLAYYSVAAREEFWTEHWGGHSVEELLAVARASPLTPLVTAALPAQGRVLEAGCGLGQYVLLLRERGWQALGVDWSVDALAGCRRVARAPVAAMELRALAVRDSSMGAYISLGVVEHDPDGPDAILAEARRVLAPGGVLVVSVPYLNGLRRLAAPYLRRRGRRIAARGGSFYQYAFSRAELMDALRRHGFAPRAAHPYDPVRIIRGALKGIRSRWSLEGLPQRGRAPMAAGGRGSAVREAVRALFYTPPALRLLGHMLLVVAVKA